MYKKLLSILLLLPVLLYAQSYEEVEQKVWQYPDFRSLADLGIRIQNDFQADSLRVRAAFAWLAHNVAYGWHGGTGQSAREKIAYSSEREKEEAIKDLVETKVDKAFRLKKGVCIDYSLMLNALIEQFGLPSKIITGVAKTEIKRIKGEPSYRNHSWNAVQLAGKWRLMDPTWAAGNIDPKSGHFVRHYLDHYFFTDPADFIRHHLPNRAEWQLLDTPVDAATFYAAPIFLPDYCEKDVHLSPRTSGVLTLSEDQENYLYFDRLPSEHLMHYTINGSGEFRRMGFRKGAGNSYTSQIKLRKRFNRQYEYLTVYMNDTPILNFRIEEELPQ